MLRHDREHKDRSCWFLGDLGWALGCLRGHRSSKPAPCDFFRALSTPGRDAGARRLGEHRPEGRGLLRTDRSARCATLAVSGCLRGFASSSRACAMCAALSAARGTASARMNSSACQSRRRARGSASTPAGFSRAKSRPTCRSSSHENRTDPEYEDRQGARSHWTAYGP